MEERVPFLVATSEPLREQRFPVTAEGLILGRDDTCDVVIPSEGVSRQHARVLWHNGAIWVQDEGSRNGVFVNDKRVQRHKQVGPGDELVVGEQRFTLEVVMMPADPTQSLTMGIAPAEPEAHKASSSLPIVVGFALAAVGAAIVIVMALSRHGAGF